ncbi:MAG: hypothetical protein WAN35_14665 [Terracidiphilus sp.]
MGEFGPSTLYAQPDLSRIQTGLGWMQVLPADAIVAQLSLNAILCHYSLPPREPACRAAKKAKESKFLRQLGAPGPWHP